MALAFKRNQTHDTSASLSPSLPPNLAAAIDRAGQQLTRHNEIHTLIGATESRLSSLATNKTELEKAEAEAEVSLALGDCGPDGVADARRELAEAESALKTASATLPVLRSRLIEQEAGLRERRADVDRERQQYAVEVIAAFRAGYEAAAKAFSTILAKGKALGAALRVNIDMPAPIPSSEPIDIGPAARVSQTLDAIDRALIEIDRVKQAVTWARLTRKPFSPEATFRFDRDITAGGVPYKAGQEVTRDVIDTVTLRRLYEIKAVRVA